MIADLNVDRALQPPLNLENKFNSQNPVDARVTEVTKRSWRRVD